ncbi:murein biosynthesis integral membrane protein MurJ [Neokomagataea anthophila]|uniref:Probable lipid II flippase MurJ n=1 Tax=Neokomagataea anthophila TaxID=2826925 RepID=A0ABS5E7P0_9PROT|nr:murein biosynthesis integral membrane protein MurJ [Neokomagataea anthophila]MBR0559932.1 murein biosynthesis integral membrane protein MurJ [Neokomagataea anthophila]
MIRNFLTVGGWTMLSRVLGLIRDQLLYNFLGAGPALDAYLVALRLPNMFRRLFGEGALNAAFVPMFTGKYETEGHDKALRFASQALSALVAWLVILTVICEIFTPIVISLTSDFQPGGDRFSLAVALTRITFPYMVLICAAALVAGILNGRGYYSAASAAYLAFNVIGIASTYIGYWGWHDVVFASAWGVTISGAVQLGALLWATKRAGILPFLLRPTLSPDIRQMLRRMGPGLLGSGVTQINLTVDTIIATKLPVGGVSILYAADRLNQLPLGVLGAAAATTLMPVLSKHAATNDAAGGRASLNRALNYALLLTLPATAGLIALAPILMTGLFAYGHFSTQDALLAAECLRAYAAGLPAFILIKVLSPGFFAHGDTKTPVRIGFFTLALNLGLNLALFHPLGYLGPPLASTLAAIVNVLCLAFILHRREVFQPDAALIKHATRTFGAALLMALWVAAGQKLLAPYVIYQHGLLRVIVMAFLVVLGAAIYGGALDALGIVKIKDAVAALQKRIARRRSR